MLSDWFDSDTKVLVGVLGVVGIALFAAVRGHKNAVDEEVQLSGHRAAVMTECLHTGHAVLECKDLLR